MLTTNGNTSLLNNKGNIASPVSSISTRVDLTDDEKLDMTAKVKMNGLTILGSGVILKSSTNKSLVGVAAGVQSTHGTHNNNHPANRFLDTLNDF